MLVELIGGTVLLLAGGGLWWEVARTRRRIRHADWLLTRADAAISEARRASVTVGGLQLVDHLLGVVTGDGEPDPDAAC